MQVKQFRTSVFISSEEGETDGLMDFTLSKLVCKTNSRSLSSTRLTWRRMILRFFPITLWQSLNKKLSKKQPNGNEAEPATYKMEAASGMVLPWWKSTQGVPQMN
uniref:Uncharacterized protein n=1 Tax=Ditylenchus dipsaci TaxID=166011 RepID=A0A915CW88_9BILA